MSVIDDATPINPAASQDGMGEMPSLEAILEMIDNAKGISDEEKMQIKDDVVKFRMETEEGLNYKATTAAVAGGILAPQNLLFIGLVLFTALILAFFAYKIIRGEKNRELIREMKRKKKEERKTRKGKKN